MKTGKTNSKLIAALGVAVLTVEGLTLAAVAPRAMTLVESAEARSLIQAGRVTLSGMTHAARDRTMDLAADVVIALLERSNRLGVSMLSVTPAPRATEICPMPCPKREAAPRTKATRSRITRQQVVEPPSNGAGRAGAWMRAMSAT